MINDYYLIYGIGPQRINTEGIACSKVFFLYPKGNLVNRCITLKNIMLVTFHYAVIVINTLICPENIGVKLAINYGFCLVNVYVLATLLKRNSAYSIHLKNKIPLFRQRIKVNAFCFTF